MADICVICKESGTKLVTCRDLKSWSTLYNAAVIKEHAGILSLSSGDEEFPDVSVRYHRECRSNFTHKKEQHSSSSDLSLNDDASTKRVKRRANSSTAGILPTHCIFCKKDKYKSREHTRERLIDCTQFRADTKVKDSALIHIRAESSYKDVANEVLIICSKDLISSEAKYHGSCYKGFIKILYDNINEKDEATTYAYEQSNENMHSLFEPIRKFCEELIKCPRIVEFKVLRKIVNDRAEELNIQLPQSYQNNLLRKLSSSFPELNFVHKLQNSVLVYPSTMEMDDLVIKYHNLLVDFKSLNKLSDNQKCIVNAGKLLHDVVVCHPEYISWPPKKEELKAENVSRCIPPLLDSFCKTLFTGRLTVENESDRSFQRRNSIAQDIVFCVSNGKVKTPKSILFPCVVKSLCNKLEVNKMISKMGHGISCNLIREVETEYALTAINQQIQNRVVIPEEEELLNTNCTVALMVADNIDNLENTATGFGTSHRVNSILITNGTKRTLEAESNPEPKKRRCSRSLPSDKVMKKIPDYYHGKRVGPGELSHIQSLDKSAKYKEYSTKQKLNFLTWIALRTLKTLSVLLVPGWTGFHICIRKGVVVIESKVSYLDTLDSPATELKTAFEVLCRGLEIKERLQLQSVLCVFDQAFYAKAAEITWKHKEKFRDIVIMLGGFHLLMMLLAILGTRYGDAGFREMAIQSEIVAEGSIKKVLTGKHYNRAIHAHKIVYEALSRLLYERFIDWMSEEKPETVSQINAYLEDMKSNMNECGFEDFDSSELLQTLNKYFYKYRENLQNEGTDMQKFWISYLELCELLLNHVYATRTGEWEFYLACIERVLPWAFAYDRQKYARFLLPFLNDMRSLPNDKPEVYEALCQGEFSVQMSKSNTFGRNEADKTIENTINRDCKTSGGYIGFSANFSATQRWVLNAARRGYYKRLLREQMNFRSVSYIHKEMSPSAIKRDIALVEKVIEVVEDIFLSPWEGGELVSVSTGIVAPPKLIDDLLNARDKGMFECMKFISTRCSSKPEKDFFDTLKKTNLMTFTDVKKVVHVKNKDKVIPLKMDKELFARMALLAQFRKIDMKHVFCYPLGPLPWSIADAYGMPRKTNKATLIHNIEKDTVPADHYPRDGTSIFDGMAVLQKFQPASRANFRAVSKSLFQLFTSLSSQNIHVVFDVYRTISIKNMERLRRSSGAAESVQYRNILPSYPVKSWNKLMASSSNKEEIVRFLVSEWKKAEFLTELSGKTLYVTEGSVCWKISRSGFQTVPELECSHEEADTRMILHAKYASGPVIIHADDTDVFILLLGHSDVLQNCFMKVGKGTKTRILDIDSIKEALLNKTDQNFLSSLIGIHAFSGCDSISSFAGKGKIKALKLLMKNPEFVSYFSELGETWTVTEGMVDNYAEFVCTLYGKRMKDVNLLRYQLYCVKGGKVEPDALPPCKSTLILHIKRANYQAAIWKRAVFQMPVVPAPDGHGWDANDTDISIKWLGTNPAPNEVLELMNCLCKRLCKVDDCSCLQAGLKCTDLCVTKCDNMTTEEDVLGDTNVSEEGSDDELSDIEDDV